MRELGWAVRPECCRVPSRTRVRENGWKQRKCTCILQRSPGQGNVRDVQDSVLGKTEDEVRVSRPRQVQREPGQASQARPRSSRRRAQCRASRLPTAALSHSDTMLQSAEGQARTKDEKAASVHFSHGGRKEPRNSANRTCKQLQRHWQYRAHAIPLHQLHRHK